MLLDADGANPANPTRYGSTIDKIITLSPPKFGLAKALRETAALSVQSGAAIHNAFLSLNPTPT